MPQPNTPFLSHEDGPVTSMNWSGEKRSNSKRSIWRFRCVALQLAVVLFATCVAIVAVIKLPQIFTVPQALLNPQMACPTRPDPYHPETLPPGKNICDCGKTIKEALERNCVYDALATAWLPPYCRDDELSAEFDRSGPGSNGEWSYFADETGTVRLDRNQIGLLGETGGKFWTSRNWHIAHCLFYWQKYYRMRETGAIMEERFDNLIHVKHCTHLATKKAPDYFFLIGVPVRMNSSWP